MSAAIQDHVAEHTRLTNEIEEIDYAPPTLKQVESQLSEVNKQLTGSRNALGKLEKATKKEYQEWAEIRDRTSKRFWERVKHPRSYQEKLSDKESKEEREYLEAFEEERRLKAEIEAMEGEVASYENEIKNLKPLATQHERLRKSLEQLYERVFGGPTPSHPEEDQAEQAYQAALTHYNELQGRVTNESRAYDLLKQADRAMAMSYRNMTNALSASQFDMFGGGMGADMMERNALSEAQRCADQARMFVVQAKGLQPLIRDLSEFQVPRASMGDIFFDNIFTDMAMHDKIQQSAKRLQISHLELREVLSQSLSHLHGLEQQSRSVEGELNSARERLKGVRKGIMELAGESLPVYTGGAPPGYVPPPPADQGQTQGQVQGQGRYYGNPFASSLEQQQYSS